MATRRANQRARILSAAHVEFARLGYHATGVDDILRRAGVARGTFYQLWKGKRELFDAVVDQLFELVLAHCRPISVGGERSVEQQIHDLVRDLVGTLIEHRELAKILLNEAIGLDAELEDKLTGFYDRLLTLLEGSLARGQQMGIVRAGDTAVLATCLVGCIKEVLYQYILGTRRPPPDRLIDELHRFVIHGLRG